jgi:predicted MPP superfamily phosphohydrolase
MFFFLPVIFVLLGYAWWRIRFILPRKYRWPGAFLFIFCFAANFIHRVIDNNFIAVVFQVIGTYTIVFLVNWLLFCFLWDLYLGIRRLCGKKYIANKRLRMRREPALAGAVAVLTLSLFLIGAPSQLGFKVTKINDVQLSTNPNETLRIAVFSDIHFDPFFQRSKLERLLDSLRIYRPDAIFFVGDLSDISTEKLNTRGFDSLFKQINAPLGFYATTGNHENIGRTNSIEWLRNLGNVIMLMDSTACNDYFCVTGRLDHHFGARTPLKELMPKNDSVPWFLLDHQPKGLDKEDTALSRLPDLAMSGHTHAGQFYPAKILIDRIWRLSYGRGNLDGIPWFVTAGIGQWMPIRVGTHNELVIFVSTLPTTNPKE